MLCCGEYGDMLNVCAIDNKATVHHDICDTPSKYEEGHNISPGVTDISLRVFLPLDLSNHSYVTSEPSTTLNALSSSSLNPYADVFTPLHTTGNRAMKAIFSTLLILCALMLREILNINRNLHREDLSPQILLRNLKLNNANKIVIRHLNINSIRNKFDSFKYLIDENIGIILLSETKLNDTFPVNQFIINGFHAPYRADRTDKGGGGLLLFVREHLPVRELKIEFPTNIEVIIIEINLKKRKWVLIGSYNPHKNMNQNHLNSLGNYLNELCKKYDNFILLGDFNSV